MRQRLQGFLARLNVGIPVELIAPKVLESKRPALLSVICRRSKDASWLSVKSAKMDSALTLIDNQANHHGSWQGGGGDVLGAFRAKRACTLSLSGHARSGHGTCTLRALAVE